MFNGCKALTSLDVSNFDTSNVTSIDNMFGGCAKMLDIEPPKNLYISHAINDMTLLTREELIQWLNALSVVTTNPTVNLGATLRNKLTSDDKAIAINKGWNIA